MATGDEAVADTGSPGALADALVGAGEDLVPAVLDRIPELAGAGFLIV